MTKTNKIFFLFSLTISLIYNLPPVLIDKLVLLNTNNTLRLVNTSGTVWNGAADIVINKNIFSHSTNKINGEYGSKDFLVLLKKITWKIKLSFKKEEGFFIKLILNHKNLLIENNSFLIIKKNFFLLPSGSLSFLKIDASEIGGVLSFFKPKFNLTISWDELKLVKNEISSEKFKSEIHIKNFESGLSSLKPLGSFKLKISKKNNFFLWSLKSDSGSIIGVNGNGEYSNYLDGKFIFKCLRHCDYLGGFLEAIGKKNGDVYELVLRN